MLCEAGSWTTARIIRIEPSYEALHHYKVDIRGLAINHAINCQKAGKLRGLFFRASLIVRCFIGNQRSPSYSR